MSFRKNFAVVTVIAFLSSCSSGSPSNDDQAIGGITPNSDPVITLIVSDETPSEGFEVTLDASQSSDADGDNLSFVWTQLSGPDLVFEGPDAAITNFVVPNIDSDTNARIQLMVSDDKVAVTEEVAFDFSNVILEPSIPSTFTQEHIIEFENPIVDILRAVGSGIYNYLIYEKEEITGRGNP